MSATGCPAKHFP
uniref:Uncharacterized protein n=1 Tax=Anguilla anguilla TaxID=7936 RepID=A0A0E9RGU2_ANGAN